MKISWIWAFWISDNISEVQFWIDDLLLKVNDSDSFDIIFNSSESPIIIIIVTVSNG